MNVIIHSVNFEVIETTCSSSSGVSYFQCGDAVIKFTCSKDDVSFDGEYKTHHKNLEQFLTHIKGLVTKAVSS